MQKDPGEYLSELQRFAAIRDASLRRHAIDVHLERWEQALRHLVAAAVAGGGAWDEVRGLLLPVHLLSPPTPTQMTTSRGGFALATEQPQQPALAEPQRHVPRTCF